MSPRLPRITASQVVRALQRAGWEVKRQDGSHVQLKHPDQPGLVTVAFHPGTIIKPGTLTGILHQASLTVEELMELL
ncbi:MAG: type II toxin-antitoxin system HicA family toxin [Chloroflexota bacterium]